MCRLRDSTPGLTIAWLADDLDTLGDRAHARGTGETNHRLHYRGVLRISPSPATNNVSTFSTSAVSRLARRDSSRRCRSFSPCLGVGTSGSRTGVRRMDSLAGGLSSAARLPPFRGPVVLGTRLAADLLFSRAIIVILTTSQRGNRPAER